MNTVSIVSIPTVVPGAQSAPGSAAKSAHAKDPLRGLFAAQGAAGSFASLFGQQTAALATSAQSSSGSSSQSGNVLAQLTAQLQSGTPLSTIVDQIAQSVGQAAAQQLQGKYASGDIDRIRNSITQSIANALSPPGNAPPGSAAEEAAALAARLQQVVESLARDVENGAGQQNELSGNILDAISAKDIPAQQKTNGSQGGHSPSVSPVVRSLIASALTALNAASQNAPQAAATSASIVPVTAPAQTPASTPTATTGAASSSFAANVPSGSIAMPNAPDLLARMLVRAAGVDATINGSAAAVSGQGGQSASPSPSVLASRFAALLGEDMSAGIASSNSSASGQNGASSGDAGMQSFAQTPSTASTSNAFAIGAIATPSMAAQIHDAINGSAPSASPVDANAVIEQLVKGIAMRTDQQGTSEIRLQLQPENLGSVTMRLTVSGSQVSASVVAQNADVRNTIVANHQDLARSLASAGLTLSGFSVDVSGGDAGSDQNKDRTAGFGRRFTVHEVGGASADETSSDSSSGPQLLGSSSLELFNYLA